MPRRKNYLLIFPDFIHLFDFMERGRITEIVPLFPRIELRVVRN